MNLAKKSRLAKVAIMTSVEPPAPPRKMLKPWVCVFVVIYLIPQFLYGWRGDLDTKEKSDVAVVCVKVFAALFVCLLPTLVLYFLTRRNSTVASVTFSVMLLLLAGVRYTTHLRDQAFAFNVSPVSILDDTISINYPHTMESPPVPVAPNIFAKVLPNPIGHRDELVMWVTHIAGSWSSVQQAQDGVSDQQLSQKTVANRLTWHSVDGPTPRFASEPQRDNTRGNNSSAIFGVVELHPGEYAVCEFSIAPASSIRVKQDVALAEKIISSISAGTK
jgi:hypothetical protein